MHNSLQLLSFAVSLRAATSSVTTTVQELILLLLLHLFVFSLSF